MKKTLLSLALGVAALWTAPTASSAVHTLGTLTLDRSGWSITGCSEHNANGEGQDGGYRHITDGNNNTFWHSEYSATGHSNTCPHYFVIDRGENASSNPFNSFGYLPRQADSANGYVQEYRIYVLDDVTGLSVAKSTTNGTAAAITDNHASLNTFLEGKTPALQGNLGCVQNDVNTHTLRGDTFPEAQTGRYVLFIFDTTSSNAGANLHANCAEFYLYYSMYVDDESPYYLRLSETEDLYLQLQSSSNGTKAEVSNTIKTPVFLIPGTGDNEGKFAIKNPISGKYFSSDAYWTSTYNNNNAYYWGMAVLNSEEITIAQNGNAANLAGIQDTHTIWTDNYVGRIHNNVVVKVKWALEKCSGWALPEAVNSEDLEKPKYILIKNVRTTGRNGVTYAVTPGSSGKLELKLNSELNEDGHYHTGALWYMQDAGTVDIDGYQPVRIYNAYTNEAITNPANGSWATSGDATIWYLKANTQTYTGYNILHAKNVTDNDYGWNDDGGFGTSVGYWKGNDPGSIWTFELAEEEKVEATLDKISEAYGVERKAYVDLIKSYVEMGLMSFNEEQQSAWNTAAATRIKNADHLHTLMTALKEQASAATANQVADGQGRHVQFLHDQRPAYIGVTSDGSVKRGGSEGTHTFSLKNTEDGTGFYLYHEYTNKYVKQPTATSENISMVSEQSEASIYNFDISNATKGLVGVKVVSPSGHVDSSHPYLHSNGTADVANVVKWEKGDNSAWYIHFVDEAQAATEYLAGAMASSGSLPENSDEVGFVSINVDAVAAVTAGREAAEGLAEDADAAAKREAGDAIYNAMALLNPRLNYPKHGVVYSITCLPISERGGLTVSNDADNPYIWSSGKTGYIADSNRWVVVEKEGKTYLYSVVAGKFANAYGFLDNPNSSNLAGVSYAWMLSEVPTEVTINGDIYTQPTDGTSRPFVIAGGEDTTGKDRPGMMVINWLGSPIPAIAGFGGPQDGCGFSFVKLEDASEELMAAIDEALSADMDAMAAEAREAADAMVADLPENYADVVNHYSETGVAAFESDMALIDENAQADKVYSISNQAAQKLAGSISLSMTDGLCYSIANAADGKKYHALYGEVSTEDYTASEGDDIENAYNWYCTVEGNVVCFKHVNNGVDVKFALNEVELFTVSAGSKAGQVKLSPFAGESEAGARRVAALSDEEVADPEYILTSQGEGATFTTTAITEISAAADGGNDVIFDLQGRRLSAPAKGINIINGKKILVY